LEYFLIFTNTVKQKQEVLRHEHEFHHANASFETEEEHKAHHDEKMLKHLELDHGHGEHNGIHHGKVISILKIG
jgi:hypothetical protein